MLIRLVPNGSFSPRQLRAAPSVVKRVVGRRLRRRSDLGSNRISMDCSSRPGARQLHHVYHRAVGGDLKHCASNWRRPAAICSTGSSSPDPLERGSRQGAEAQRGKAATNTQGQKYRRDTTRQSRSRSQTGLNAETQRNAEKRREQEPSATLCESLRLCVRSSQPASKSRYSSAMAAEISNRSLSSASIASLRLNHFA